MKKIENRILKLVDLNGNLDETKIFAYKENEIEIKLSNILYLGIRDDGSKYYEINKEKENNEELEKK